MLAKLLPVLFFSVSALAQVHVDDIKVSAIDIGTKAADGPWRHAKVTISYVIKNDSSTAITVYGGFDAEDAFVLSTIPISDKNKICTSDLQQMGPYNIDASSSLKKTQVLYNDVAVAGGTTTVGARGCFVHPKGILQEKMLIGVPSAKGTAPTVQEFTIRLPSNP